MTTPDATPGTTEQIVNWLFWAIIGLTFTGLTTYCVWSLKRIVRTLDTIDERSVCHAKQLAVLKAVPGNIDDLYSKVNKIETEFSHLQGEHAMAMAGALHTHSRSSDK